jgi:hypothetical protein
LIDDQRIDDVAREMTSAPADERLAERVAARIARAPTSRTWTWVLVPIAAAVLLIAVFVAREKPGQVRLKPDTTSDVTAIAAGDRPVRPAPQQAVLPVVTRTGMRAAVPIVPIAQAPAPVLDPIEIDSIAVQPLVETNAIRIAPIAIDRIDISPMP